ncbi:hypothetical protein N7466_003354 [Penicillium verhagenii]|uniref:uncharacterized protein n=1 Tax=Penicillium verhagenii TaxID=1562060 RepID=UPI002544E6A3|nr:uncharacterized protein N7466_003354 [Penicillium verhagenii]KAJ5936904.1 hypothetical protein N7466_003354 [Penicillium verhagenii]
MAHTQRPVPAYVESDQESDVQETRNFNAMYGLDSEEGQARRLMIEAAPEDLTLVVYADHGARIKIAVSLSVSASNRVNLKLACPS